MAGTFNLCCLPCREERNVSAIEVTDEALERARLLSNELSRVAVPHALDIDGEDPIVSESPWCRDACGLPGFRLKTVSARVTAVIDEGSELARAYNVRADVESGSAYL